MISLFQPKISVPGTVYSGIDNPLLYKENTRIAYGDAKTSLDALLPLID